MNEQGTAEWMADRCGKITASRISDVLTKPRKGQKESSVRRNYCAELVCERLTKRTQEGFQTWDMKRGTELEPLARADYEIARGVIVNNTGFVVHPTMPFAGASPDGLIDADGLVQFKCPKTANHLEYLQRQVVPAEYAPQMLWEMACTSRKWCDFVSYDPLLPEHLQLFVVRFDRDEVAIQEIEQEVARFNEEINEIIRNLPSGKTLAEQLQASLDAVPRKSKIHEAVSRAKEDPLTIATGFSELSSAASLQAGRRRARASGNASRSVLGK